MARPLSNSSGLDLSGYSCPNTNCSQYSQTGKGNISFRGYYGKMEKRPLLYCRLCGQRFSATVGTALYGSHLDHRIIESIIHHAAEGVGVSSTARLLNLSQETVNQVIRRIGLHCAKRLDDLIKSLSPIEVQLDELWAFVKKKDIMSLLTKSGIEAVLRPRIQRPKTKN